MIFFVFLPMLFLFFYFQIYRTPHFYIVFWSLVGIFLVGMFFGLLLSPGLLGVESQNEKLGITLLLIPLVGYWVWDLSRPFRD